MQHTTHHYIPSRLHLSIRQMMIAVCCLLSVVCCPSTAWADTYHVKSYTIEDSENGIFHDQNIKIKVTYDNIPQPHGDNIGGWIWKVTDEGVKQLPWSEVFAAPDVTGTEYEYNFSPDAGEENFEEGVAYIVTLTANYEASNNPFLTTTPEYYSYHNVTAAVSGAAKWGTFIANEQVEIPSAIGVYTPTSGSTSTAIILEKSSNTVPANTPVFLYSTTDWSKDYHLTSVPSESTTTTAITSVLSLVGTQWGGHEADVKSYILEKHDDKGQAAFYKVTDAAVTMPANRLYLTVKGAEANSISIDFAVTAISQIAEGKQPNGKIVKLIQDGRLVIKKGGKTYNIAGKECAQ